MAFVVTHPVGHVQLHYLLRRARRRGLTGGHRLLGWKYLGTYLASRLGTRARRNALAYHYRFLLERLGGGAALAQLGAGIPIWASPPGGEHRYEILMQPSTFSRMEGECQLGFFMDGARIFTLTFTVVAGQMLGLACPEAMFIGSVQGGYRCRERIRIAARENGEVAPLTMLVIAAKTVAEALQLDCVVAASSTRLAAQRYARDKISALYDEPWLAIGATPTEGGYFIVAPEAPEAPLEHLSRSHRARARRKRHLRQQLRDQMRASLAGTAWGPSPHATGMTFAAVRD